MKRIGFLHTSPVHTTTFELLVAHTDGTVETVTIVNETLLDDARLDGPASDRVRAGINDALDLLVESGAQAIVCTCSTIGGQAEIEGSARSIDVMRVDRPMAEAAVRAGRRITVLATIDSTTGPTADLLAEVARSNGTDIEVTVRVCDDAWEHFERGDLDQYVAIVAAECNAAASSSDVIVLAQASMARAAEFCTTSVPVISSPLRAVEAAVGEERQPRLS
ncbi:MAG TPA: aspartate/glutamate racemase family protein [Ilumatobacteraceae bacterium]|nr:aspartate/glutamate racemase family protein [Ilumatobacteraceae bacterium]